MKINYVSFIAQKVKLRGELCPLFCLAFPENLTNDVLKQVLDICQSYLLSDEALAKFKHIDYSFALVNCFFFLLTFADSIWMEINLQRKIGITKNF